MQKQCFCIGQPLFFFPLRGRGGQPGKHQRVVHPKTNDFLQLGGGEGQLGKVPRVLHPKTNVFFNEKQIDDTIQGLCI